VLRVPLSVVGGPLSVVYGRSQLSKDGDPAAGSLVQATDHCQRATDYGQLTTDSGTRVTAPQCSKRP